METLKGIKTVSDLVSRIETNEGLSSMFTEKPTEVLRAADTEIRENAPPLPNHFVYRAAVVFVGVTLIITVFGGFGLLLTNQTAETPEWVVALTSAGIGALAGMLRN